MTLLSPTARGRLLVLVAAILWSTSGAFAKSIDLPPTTLAMHRALWAGGALLVVVALTRTRPTWERHMLPMVVSFTAMNVLYLCSMKWTTAANAILLQSTAPLWVVLPSWLWLREAIDRRTLIVVLGGMVGIGILITGDWAAAPEQRTGIVVGLLSGIAYSAVVVYLRALRRHASLWLAALNHSTAGIAIGAGLALTRQWTGGTEPLAPAEARDWVLLALFGTTQMALPYVLFGLGLRTLSPQEAGILALAEPVLNPLWAYLVVGEVPSTATRWGGALFLGMLAARYLFLARAPGSDRSRDPPRDAE